MIGTNVMLTFNLTTAKKRSPAIHLFEKATTIIKKKKKRRIIRKYCVDIDLCFQWSSSLKQGVREYTLSRINIGLAQIMELEKAEEELLHEKADTLSGADKHFNGKEPIVLQVRATSGHKQDNVA